MMCPGGGNPPGGGDKPPGVFKVRKYENDQVSEAHAKIDELIAKGKEILIEITTYKELSD